MKDTWTYPSLYHIKGTGNVTSPEYDYFNNLELYPKFQLEFEQFKTQLLNLIESPTPSSILRYGDGDHFFLKKQAIGSANPGARSLGVPYDQLNNHEDFIQGVLENDLITAEIFVAARNYFEELYPEREIDFPLEYIYGIIANKWLFKNFNHKKIGLIGASEKLYVIEELMQHKEYQDYLQINSFTDYIHFPQKFACDDIDLVENFVSSQLKDSTSDVFLVGIGSAKLALLSRFKKYRNSLFLDVGCGIDALAGCVNWTRPYFYDWTNFKLKNYNYNNIDYMGYTGKGKQIIL